jgi:hypothetical protein
MSPQLKMPNYHFHYWGPMLFKIKLNLKDLKECAKLCSKKSSSFADNLAGVIKHEHYVNPPNYYKIIESYLNPLRHCYKQWYGKPLNKNIRILSAWVNFMVAGEFNPPHIHTGCDFSSILFIKIPEELKEEHKSFTGRGGGPGSLSFMYGEENPYSISHRNFFPREGDFYIFPANLTHFVASFMSEGERTSMSANFKLE